MPRDEGDGGAKARRRGEFEKERIGIAFDRREVIGRKWELDLRQRAHMRPPANAMRDEEVSLWSTLENQCLHERRCLQVSEKNEGDDDRGLPGVEAKKVTAMTSIYLLITG